MSLVYYSLQTEGLVKLGQVIKLLLKIHSILDLFPNLFVSRIAETTLYMFEYIYMYIHTWICIKANAFLPEYEMKRRAIRAVT